MNRVTQGLLVAGWILIVIAAFAKHMENVAKVMTNQPTSIDYYLLASFVGLIIITTITIVVSKEK